MNKKQLKALAVPVAVALAMLVFNWITEDSQSPNTNETDLSTQIEEGSGTPLSSLPQEATETWELIESNGPFPYEQDDSNFGNFEGNLPDEASGYYREYTVGTPGLNHRGAKRLVVGEGGEVYYTDDHYDSFELVDTDS